MRGGDKRARLLGEHRPATGQSASIPLIETRRLLTLTRLIPAQQGPLRMVRVRGVKGTCMVRMRGDRGTVDLGADTHAPGTRTPP